MTGTSPDKADVLRDVGTRLRNLRQAYGEMIHDPAFAMKSFARALDVDEERYRTWERGTREMPLWMLLRIKHLTGCSIDVLLEGALSLPGREIYGPDLRAYQQAIDMAQRIRWVRELFEPDIEKFADIMRVPLQTWHRWELGLERPDLQHLADFAERVSVSLDFLWFGKLIGVDAELQNALLELHPPLRPPGYKSAKPRPYSRKAGHDGNNGQQNDAQGSPRGL